MSNTYSKMRNLRIVVWEDAVHNGQVITTLYDGRYTTRILQDSVLDEWEDSRSTREGAKILHAGYLAMAHGVAQKEVIGAA